MPALKKLQSERKIRTGITDIHVPPSFISSQRHTDVSPEELSDRWGIGINTARKTLQNTTHTVLRSTTLPLSRRYKADCMFHRKTLSGTWETDTIDGRARSLDGNQYAQVFTNRGYFAKLYPMESKSSSGDALKIFCREFGVPEKLISDGSKEQTGKNT